MTGKYAEQTKVPIERSKSAIEQIVRKYEASGFLQGEFEGQVIIGFAMQDRQVRFKMDVSGLSAQQERQRWRALLLTIKSKLESVECGIETFDDAFLAQIVLPNGELIGEWAKPQIESSYKSGDMPPLLPAPTGAAP